MTGQRITKADLAELCRRVDLPALLAADGVRVHRRGATFACSLRSEDKSPSCYLYPPGVGRRGSDGWTLKDYGDGWGGDALAYLVEKRGLSFLDAVRELADRTGWIPDGLDPERSGRPRTSRRMTPAAAPVEIPVGPPPLLPEEQLSAAYAFIGAVVGLCPGSSAKGSEYLAGRGCLPDGWPGGAYVLTGEDCRELTARLAYGPDAPLLHRAGLLKPAADGKPVRLAWWDRVCLLACYDAEGSLAYFVGRRLDWTEADQAGKYINQPCAWGAVRLPYNLPALYHVAGRLDAWPVKPAPDKAGDVLLVEGPLDALGAAVLGWPAVALLNRPQAYAYTDTDGAAARMLEDHLPALRDVRRVLVVPDADPGDKGAEGAALAGRLVGWLRHAGVKADVVTLLELGAPAGCKDLAEWAATSKREKVTP